jgi:hypothetical protein
MGYTHYWRFGAFITEKSYKQALSEIRKLIKASPVPLANHMGDVGTKPSVGPTVSFNGVGEDSHETFILRADPTLVSTDNRRYPTDEINRFDFTKTARKPYDIIVTAALCVLQERLGASVEVTSDGNADDWEAGRAFAEKVLGRPVKVPARIETAEQEKARYEEYKRSLENRQSN